ncbi:type IV secretion system DNA-binding domain-containing protein [Candidatus Uhrbacteria bacterium]|nr:type IV secretion system DNA-binding domain-containing protein [Candidatus Uhrbacteria bacterium]
MPIDFLIAAIVLLLAIVCIVVVLFIVRAIARRSAMLRAAFDLVVLQVLVPKDAQGGDKGDQSIQKIQEAIAKTEVFFTSIGGLRAQRGMGSWFRGRTDHIAFEIVAHDGQVKFFVAVPNALRSFLEEQLHAQRSDAYIDVARDYNIFQPTGVVLGTTLTLKRSGYFPVKSYKKLDADPLDGLTNAMSKVTELEGAAIQLVVRSARKEWRSGGVSIASKMQQGKTLDEAMGGGWMSGLWKSVGAASGTASKQPEKIHQLSPMEQEIVKGLEEKAAKFGVDVNVRVLVSAETNDRAKTLLASITQAFAQYNIPQYGNMFVTGGTSSAPKLIEQFIYRKFDEKKRLVLNVEEMASVWHLPLPTTETPTVQWLSSRRLPPPVNMPQEGVILGESNYRGKRVLVRLKRADRRRHVYAIGGTGTGKTTVMENMCVQDIRAGEGVCVIDPHGEFAEHMLANVPKERADDVIYFDPSDVERPLGLNMLEADTPEAQDFATQEMVAIFYKLVTDPSMIGPMFEHYMRNAMLTLMSDPKNPSTIVEIPRILTDPEFQKLKLKNVTDPIIRAFWEKELPQTSGQTKGEMLPYLVSKIGRFLENTMMRNIIGQQRSAFDFRQIMDQKKILLCNLSKGKIGAMNSDLLGLIIITKLQMAALARANVPEDQRPDFFCYMDEFQNFITDSIAIILSEARKYRLDLIMAHQYIAQLVKSNDTRVRDAVFGNVGTIISYRIGVDDSELIAKQLAPVVSEFDVLNIEKFNAYARIMIDNTAQKAFNMRVFAPSFGDQRMFDALRQLSRLKYGRDRAIVETEILERSQLG